MKVLVAPLDWGLGHATRCIPVIREFLNQGAQVEIAVVKENAALFREVFPDIRQRLAPSYHIVYPKHGYNMGLWLLKNSVHLKKVMKFEHRYAEEMVARHGYDVLFSDNRFAFYSKKAYSIYMTHQRRIAFPETLSAFENIGIRWHSLMMRHFNEVWVPDIPQSPGYAGSLSHVKSRLKSMSFVGALSRFMDLPQGNGDNQVEANATLQPLNVTAVVSGVEPARTQFENQLRSALKNIPGHHVMILGRPSLGEKSWKEGNIEFHNHLPTERFADVVNRSNWVVSRGGYSTIMDMAVLGAKCILVPTPGQYEQIVLAQELSQSNYAVHIPANKLSYETLMLSFERNVSLPKPSSQNLLHDAVAKIMKISK